MTRLTIIGAVVGAIVALLIITVAAAYFGALSRGNQMEQTIDASYVENQNMRSTYSSMIAEAAQIPAMQRDDLTKVVQAALEARYGDEGSQAMFQFITEQNPQIDSKVYTKIQDIIQSGRTDFKRSQDQRIDRCRVYKTALGAPWDGFWLRLAGFPRFELEQKCRVVVTSDTQRIFESGTDEVLKLR